jgi:Rieske Fe-S protein
MTTDHPPLPDDPAAAPTRRQALGRLAMWASLVAAYGTAASFVARFLYPRRRSVAVRKVYVCRRDELRDGESRETTDLRGLPVLLVRQGEGVRALSKVCPHLGCRVRWEQTKDRFFCPCHDGVFDREGRVVSGPAPRALDRYEVEVAGGAVYLSMKEPNA